jgi:predicted transcriptional regulator
MEMIHIMTRHPETIHPDDTLAKAKEMMDVAGFRRLPVVKDASWLACLPSATCERTSAIWNPSK